MDADVVARAVAILRAGGVVAIPTETVYGLAGAVEQPAAIARIYAIKGRPADHPLIVHVSDVAALDGYVAEIPPALRVLAEHFWPGPLTAIVDRGPRTPVTVTGGQNTVAVRVPSHPVAHAILAAFGGALAAPSANRFGAISPTNAQHVRASLGDDVDLVVDGGDAAIGIESTIVDLSSQQPAILRAGAVTASQVSAALGVHVAARDGGEVRAPGMLSAHYAPQTRFLLLDARARDAEVARRRQLGQRVGVLELPDDPTAAAHALYARLRVLDEGEFDMLVAAQPPSGEAWDAVRDRLQRASARA